MVSDAVIRLVDEATLTGSLLVLAGADLATAELGTLTRAALPVIAIGTRTWDPAWNGTMPTTVTAPRLTLAQRQALWEDLLPDQDVPREAVALRLTPEQIHQVAVAAGAAAAEDGLDRPDLAHLRAAARRFCRGQYATETGVTIDDLVLPSHVRREVVRLLDWTRYRDEVAELGPLHGKGKGTGICALFAGSPGTGKTLAAHVVADALGMDLMQVDLSSVLSKYIGESERNLEQVVHRRRGHQRCAVLRRGGCPVRGAVRGEGRPRPVCQPGDLLPAAADGELRRRHHPGDEPARKSRSGVRPPAALRHHLPGSGRRDPGRALAPPPGGRR